MEVFYLEHDIFSAKYNLKDQDDGDTDTDITLFTSKITTDSNSVATIVASEDGHKKVVHFETDGDNGTYAIWIYGGLTETGTVEIEFWLKYIDNGQGRFRFYIRDSGHNSLTEIHINSADNKLYWYWGNGAGGNNNSNVAVVSDTWIHIRQQINVTTDKQSIWLDGVLKLDDQNLYSDKTTLDVGEYLWWFDNGGGANALEGYLDAVSEPGDANYEIGDNLEVDWHTYNKEQITSITQYPTIVPRLDAYWIGSVTIRDFEGALFSSWNDRDFNKILIEDGSDNILFRGFLIKKTFTTNSMELTIAGIGILLDWQPFGSDGYVNYILAEGLVKAPISADSILQVKDNDGIDFTWDVDWWIKEGRDLGILIVEGGAVSTREWQSSAISQTSGTVVSGNNASTLTFMDSDSYRARGESYPNLGNVITPVIDAGVAVDDTDYLKSIEVQYNFRLIIGGVVFTSNKGTVHLQIKREVAANDFRWDTIAKASIVENFGGEHIGGWVSGVPIDVDGGNGNQFVIKGTDAELQYYFHKTGATYTSLAGLRFVLTGVISSGSYVDIDIDFIKVKVGYKSDDISPIMEQITDSAATSLTCSNVSAWDETGVAVDDSFKIGQNTRVILQDVASQAGIEIFCGTPKRVVTLRPDQDGTNNDWTSSGYGRVDEVTPDGNAIHAVEADHLEYEEFGFPNSIDLEDNETVTEVKVYTYGKIAGALASFTVDVYYNGAWQGSQGSAAGVNYAWEDHTFTITGGTVVPDDLQVRYKANVIGADGHCYVDTCYVEVTVEYAYAFERYTARKYIGAYCMEPTRAICKLEGAHWYEDYINDRIVVLKPAAYLDSGVDLTEADYGHDWVFEDNCNQVRSFYVFGNAENEVFAKAVDGSVDGYLSRQIVDETISNDADAQEIADAQLALLKDKRPSIRLPLDGVRANLQLGKTVDVTLARPTLAKANYVIRKIERSKKGKTGIRTVIYVGLGESTIGEKLAKIIRNNAFRSHKALTDRLISP